MKEPCSSEMFTRPHMDLAYRPFSSHVTYCMLPASRDLRRRRGLSAVLAGRKAATEAPSVEADTASTQEKGTLVARRRKDMNEVPSWMVWDERALKEQEEDLARFQVCIPPLTAIITFA